MGIPLFFSVSILPSLALKRWNFPDNLDFKGKIVAKFYCRSHFLSICNNMTVKQHINHGAIQKVCHLHNGVFFLLTCLTLSQFLSIPSLTLFTKNYKLWKERKETFFCIHDCFNYHVISKEVENRVFRHNRIFRQTSNMWYTDRLLDLFFLLVTVVLSEVHENPGRRNWVTEKNFIEELVWGTSLFWLPGRIFHLNTYELCWYLIFKNKILLVASLLFWF